MAAAAPRSSRRLGRQLLLFGGLYAERKPPQKASLEPRSPTHIQDKHISEHLAIEQNVCSEVCALYLAKEPISAMDGTLKRLTCTKRLNESTSWLCGQWFAEI